MDTPKTHPPGRVAPPDSGDERGWLALVLEAHPTPAWVVDPATGQVLVRNAAARAFFPDPLTGGGQPRGHFTTNPGARVDPGALVAHLATDARGSGTELAWHAPEREAHFRIFWTDLPPADGQAPLALITFVEVTEQKSAERELRQAIEARDEFFSVATHELKDPLFAIQLSLQLLQYAAAKQGDVPGFVTHHLEVCGRQVDRLSRLVENLLDVSRIQNRRLQLEAEAIDLGELAREAAGRFQEKARSVGSTLAVEGPGPVIGYFDRMKLDQVLSNLLSNALKYGAGKPVVVRVREEGEFATLEVEDHGVGIAPEDQARVFGRFERASNGHRRESLGLGLYIVRSLVEAHGGTVAVRSAPGQGATFTVTLPRNRLAEAQGNPGDNLKDTGS